jgi:hypothetical protein
MELGGTIAGAQYDQLQIGGSLSLDGTLAVSLLDGFSPRYSDTFDLLDFGALDGEFQMVSLPALNAGLSWDTSALYSTGTINAVPEPATLLLAVLACIAPLVYGTVQMRSLSRHIHPERTTSQTSGESIP